MFDRVGFPRELADLTSRSPAIDRRFYPGPSRRLAWEDHTVDPHLGPEPMSSALVLLPTLNEEAGLAATLAELRQVPGFTGRSGPKILVVDGGSTDGTRDVASRHGVEVILQHGRGKGAAIRDGLAWGRDHGFSRVGVLDADGTYPCDRLPILFGLLDAGGEVVIGVRRPTRPAGATARDLVHRIGNAILNLSAAQLSRGPLLDVCSGFWGLSTSVLAELDLRSDGFEIESELFVKAARRRLRIVQIPIEYRPRIGTPKLHAVRDGSRIFLSIVRHGLGGTTGPRPDPAGRLGSGGTDAKASAVLNDVRTLLLALGSRSVVIRTPFPGSPEAETLARTLRTDHERVEVNLAGPTGTSGPLGRSPERSVLPGWVESPSSGTIVTLPGGQGEGSRSAPVLVDIPSEGRRILLRVRSERRRRSIHSIAAGTRGAVRSRPPGLGILTLLSATLEPSGTRKLEALLAANLRASTLAVLPRFSEARTPVPVGSSIRIDSLPRAGRG